MTCLREGEDNGPYREVEVLRVLETYAIGNRGFCLKWFRAQPYVKVVVGCTAKRNWKGETKRINKEAVYSGENCCVVVDRRENRREENGKKTAVELNE